MFRLLGFGSKQDAEAQKKLDEAKAKQLAANQEMKELNDSLKQSSKNVSSAIAQKLEARRVIKSGSAFSSSSSSASASAQLTDVQRAAAIQAQHKELSKFIKDQEAIRAKFLADQQAKLFAEEKARFLKMNPMGDVVAHMDKFKLDQEAAAKAKQDKIDHDQRVLEQQAANRAMLSAQDMVRVDNMQYQNAIAKHHVTNVKPSKNPIAAKDDKVSLKYHPKARISYAETGNVSVRMNPVLSSAAFKIEKKKVDVQSSASAVKTGKVLPAVKVLKVNHDDVVPFKGVRRENSISKQFLFGYEDGGRKAQEVCSGLALECDRPAPGKK